MGSSCVIVSLCSVFLVGQEFFLVWSIHPFSVAIDFGKYCRTFYGVLPVHPVNNPCLTEFIHVDTTHLNAAACRYIISSDIYVDCWSLCHSGCVVLQIIIRLGVSVLQ